MYCYVAVKGFIAQFLCTKNFLSAFTAPLFPQVIRRHAATSQDRSQEDNSGFFFLFCYWVEFINISYDSSSLLLANFCSSVLLLLFFPEMLFFFLFLLSQLSGQQATVFSQLGESFAIILFSICSGRDVKPGSVWVWPFLSFFFFFGLVNGRRQHYFTFLPFISAI